MQKKGKREGDFRFFVRLDRRKVEYRTSKQDGRPVRHTAMSATYILVLLLVQTCTPPKAFDHGTATTSEPLIMPMTNPLVAFSRDAGRHAGTQMCSVVDPLTWFIQQRVHLTPHNTQFFGYTILKNATPTAQSLHPVCSVNPQPLNSKRSHPVQTHQPKLHC